MITYDISLESFIPNGKVSYNDEAGELHMTTKTALNTLFVYDDTPYPIRFIYQALHFGIN